MNQTTHRHPLDGLATGEKPTRSAILPGAIVALVALVGIECAAASTLDRTHKAAPVAVRAATHVSTAALARTTRLTCTATALVLILLLGRQTTSLTPRRRTTLLPPPADNAWPALLMRSKIAISYRTGGLYGP